VALGREATAIVVLPADLPAITALAVDGLVEAGALAGGSNGVVAIVPDRHGTGTNALLVSPAALVDPMFGPDSLARHRAAAVAAGAALVELDGPLSLDLDTTADLLAAESELGGLRG
jgi:2-phospho-L-lactate guanylyltransferase